MKQLAKEREEQEKVEKARKDREEAEKAKVAAEKKRMGGRKSGGGREHREERKDAQKVWPRTAEEKKKELWDGVLQAGEWYCLPHSAADFPF